MSAVCAEAGCRRSATERWVQEAIGVYREAEPLWCEDHALADGCCGHCGYEVVTDLLNEVGYCYECTLLFRER